MIGEVIALTVSEGGWQNVIDELIALAVSGGWQNVIGELIALTVSEREDGRM